MPNIGKNARANNIGVLNLIEAPQRDMNNADNIITEGIEIIMVVVWKNALMAVPIPVKNI